MSIVTPDARDRIDAYGDAEEDDLYFELLREASAERPDDFPWKFEPVHGFFEQSALETDDSLFNYLCQDFGIKEAWPRLMSKLDDLNQTSPDDVCYKMIFLARHGQGWHNVATAKYLKEDWMEKWRFLGTDGEITWGPDAKLTPLGEMQAAENCHEWRRQLSRGAPIPTKFYVSPLLRSIKTLQLSWEGIDIPSPMVCEKLRETIGVHLCHQKSPRSVVQKSFSFLQYPHGFDDEDVLAQFYDTDRERLHQQFLRVNEALQYIFDDCREENDSIVSITSHAGTIRSAITVIGHRKFTIPTGGMIPMVVKGTRIKK